MDDRSLARNVAIGRVLFGLLMLFVPTRVLRMLGSEDAGNTALVWLARSFGIRDVVLGSGALVELSDPEPEGRWVTAGAIADSCDSVAAVIWRDELGAAGTVVTLGIAVPAAAAGWKAGTGLRRS